MNSNTVKLVSKLSMKTIGAQPKKNSFEKDTGNKTPQGDAVMEILPPRDIAVIYGRAAKYEVGQSTFGEFTKFRGSFEAINTATGEVFKGSSCFLPPVVEELVKAAIDNATDGASVDFALQIGAQHSTGAIGYEYTVRPLTEPQEADELTTLRNLSRGALALTHDAGNSEGESASGNGKKKK